MITRRLLNRLLALALLLAFTGGCGGHRSGSAALHPDQPGAAPAPSAADLAGGLPSLASLTGAPTRQTSAAPVLELCGAQFDPALTPQYAIVQGTSLGLLPQWTPVQPPSALALALYRFNVAGYTGAPALHFDWQQAQDRAGLFIAIADFTRGRWVILPGPATDELTLTAAQFAAATQPQTQEFFVVPLLIAPAPWELAALGIGPAPHSTITLTGALPGTGRAFAPANFFPAYSGGEPASWLWDFGGGANPNTSVAKTPAVTLADGGTYICSVTALDGAGQPARRYFTLTIQAFADLKPHIYAVNPNSGDTGSQVAISALNDAGSVAAWSWNFGGGATPNTAQNGSPVITFGATGQYAASVTATNANGSQTYNFTLYVTDVGALKPPNILGVTPASGTAGSVRGFSISNIGGTPDSYSWDFGSGAAPSTNSIAIPQETLGAIGMYSGTVTATNSTGAATFPFSYSVIEQAKPHLTGLNPPKGTSNTQQTFAALNNGGTATGWSWDFGGAGTPNTSTSSLPQLQLGPAGSFNGSVTATNALGSDTLNFTLVVQDLQPPDITAVSPLAGYLLDNAIFLPTNMGGAVDTWAWDFGAACTPSTSSSGTPHAQFSAEGSHNCSVTATNAAGSMTFNFTLNIGPVRPPQLDSAGPDNAESTALVTFSAHNKGGPVATWLWDFGGGCSPNTSGAALPQVTAGANGIYSCSVQATNASGTQTYPFTLTIGDLEAPVIQGVAPNIAESGHPATFFPSLSGGPPDTYSWDFGGGATPNTSSQASPVVDMGAVGQYNGSLTVSNSQGSDTFNFVLTVIPFAGG